MRPGSPLENASTSSDAAMRGGTSPDVAEHGQAAEHHVVRLAAQVAGAREEAPQVLAPHGAPGSRANPQGVFWKSASLHSPGSSIACATRSAGPSSMARHRET